MDPRGRVVQVFSFIYFQQMFFILPQILLLKKFSTPNGKIKHKIKKLKHTKNEQFFFFLSNILENVFGTVLVHIDKH